MQCQSDHIMQKLACSAPCSPAGWIVAIEMSQTFPAAAKADDFDVVLTAAIRNGFDHRVEARNIAAAGENSDALLRHVLYLRHFPDLVRGGVR